MVDADRVEHLAEWDSGLAEVDLVVSDSDVVIGVPVDNENLDLPGEDADLVEFARRADGCPEPGESGSEHKDACHFALPGRLKVRSLRLARFPTPSCLKAPVAEGSGPRRMLQEAPIRALCSVLRGSCFARAPQDEGMVGA